MSVDWKRESRWFASIGVLIAAAGYVRYSTQGEFTWLSRSLLIGGAVLFVAALTLGFRDLAAFFSRRSSKLGTNTVTLTLLVLVVLGLLNFLGFRHHKRFDLTTEKLYTLSDQSRKISSGLTKDVDIIRFAKTPDTEFKDLVTEYTNLSTHLHYRDVDPEARPEVAHQYNVTHLNTVVISSGSHNETLDGTTEQDITNAIVKATRDTVKTLCFVEAHGERSISGSDGDGLANMAKSLQGEGYVAKAINLVSSGDVPAECNVLVAAGPKQAFFPQETQMVVKYLDGGGKALLMIDPETDPKLDPILQAWNVKLGDNVVVDASGVGRMFGTGPAVPLVVQYGASPITQNFNGTMTFFPLARTVSIADKSIPIPQGTELLMTSERSFTVPNLKVKEVQYDPKTDTAGPLSLGVASEKTIGSGDSSKAARLVLIGNSAFASNQWAGLQRNGDLFMNIVNWLAQDEDLISIRPKSPANRRVILTDTQQRELFFSTLMFLPGLVIASGLFIWLRRR